MKIGIYGFGFVGQAVYNSIINKNDVVIYDKYKHPLGSAYNKEQIVKCDIVFVCLPTPYVEDERTLIDIELEQFICDGFCGTLVIKSTILPEQLTIPKDNVMFKICSNPEFLREFNTFDDFKNQETILLGGRADICEFVADIYRNYFDIKTFNFEFCTFEQALEFKYFRNIKLSYDILFANFLYDTSIDFRKYQQLFEKFPVRKFNETNICVDGKFGFGGSCLPKDVKNFSKNRNNTLTKFIINYNEELRNK